ncbi:MAG: hypothetical protein AAGD28_17270 [Bacteroidota bacterium]
MKITIHILTVCLLLLFSCQPEVQQSQEVLTQKQLEEKLLSMDAFHQFLEVEAKVQEEIEQKRIKLDKKDHWWVLNIHEKYPKMDDFLSTASAVSIRKYTLLTGIDLMEGDSDMKALLLQIHEELSDRFIIQIADLNELLFFSEQLRSTDTSHAKSNCLRYCDREANEEFVKVLETCQRSDLTYCQHRALMARQYFHRGCMAGCNHRE